MNLRSLVFSVLFVLLFSLGASHAYGASYAPTLTTPVDGAVMQVPDGLVCRWTPDIAPSYFLVRWATSTDFNTDLLFEYRTTLSSYTVSGLPGMTKIYWQVSGVDATDTEYDSATFSFNSADDNENAGTVFNLAKKLDFEDKTITQTGWRNYYSGSYSYFTINTANSNSFLYHYGSSSNSYSNSHAYYEMTTPININGFRPQLTYNWAHNQYQTFATEKLIVEIMTTEEGIWKTLYDHNANGNNYYWTGGSYINAPDTFTKQTISLAQYQGKTAFIRFHIDTGTYALASIFLDNIVVQGYPGYDGTDRDVTVTSPYGNPIPGGVSPIQYGAKTTLIIADIYINITATERLINYGYTGTGSIPTTGTASSVARKIYRTSTLNWLWKRQFSVKVTTWNSLGDPSPDGIAWVDLNAFQLFQVNNVNEPGYTEGTRWRCTGFSGTGDVPANGVTTSVNVKVTQTGTLTWKWSLQYRLVIANRVGVDASVGHIAPAAGEYWYLSGQTQAVSADTFFDQGNGESFGNRGWTGTGSVVPSDFAAGTVTITMPSTMTWQWDKQVFLTIVSAKGQVTGNPPGWYNEGSEVTLGVQSPFIQSATIRYVVKTWTSNFASGGSIAPGTGTTTPPTKLYAPTTITWVWTIQYLVDFDSNYGTVDPPFAWADEFGTVSATAIKPDVTATEDYNWSGWTGTSNGLDPNLPSGDVYRDFVNITEAVVFRANWATQFNLDVVAQNGTLADNYSGFKNEFDSVSITAIPPAADPGTRWVPGWAGTGDGSVTIANAPGTLATVTVQILEPIHQEVYWELQYLFRIADPTGVGHPLPAIGDYWYYLDDTVSGSVEYFNGLFICDGFVGTGSAPATSSNAYYSFSITQPSSLTFKWKEPNILVASPWTNARQVTSAIQGRTVEMERMSDGSPFIVFHNPVSGTIEAAYSNDGEWITSTIDTVGKNDIGLALVLNRFDVPFIAYQDRDDSALKFATLDAGGWLIETVVQGNGVGAWVDIQIATNGTVGLVYYDSNIGSLSYAYYRVPTKVDQKQNWSIHLLDDNGNVGNYCSLAYTDSDSEPRVAYYDSTNGALKMASLFLGDTNWTIETISDDSGDFGINATLVLDPAGFAVICFRENTVTSSSQGLIFAREMPQGWQIYPLDEEGVTGFDASVALDASGYPHISYNDFGNMYYTFFNGTGWVINVIATGDIGYDTAISLDGAGNPAVVYWNNGSLYYADSVDNKFDGEIVNRYTDIGPSIVEPASAGSGGCFIATAAFSSINARTVQTLCSLRDSTLVASANGTSVVNLYYAVSPAVAGSITSSSALRSMLRSILCDR